MRQCSATDRAAEKFYLVNENKCEASITGTGRASATISAAVGTAAV